VNWWNPALRRGRNSLASGIGSLPCCGTKEGKKGNEGKYVGVGRRRGLSKTERTINGERGNLGGKKQKENRELCIHANREEGVIVILEDLKPLVI